MRAGAVLVVLVACGSPTADPPKSGEITVTVTSPAPGAELDQPMIAVAGTVATSEPLIGALEAWVNGTRIDVAADGSFTASIAPELGVNHLKIEGGDGIGELVGRELDVLWAPTYLPGLAGQTGFDITGGLELRLGQRFFDPRLLGTVLDRSTNPVVAHDVGSALELILWHINLAGLLPGGGIHVGSGNATLDVAIPSVEPQMIITDAKVVGGATPSIDLAIDLNGVFLATQGEFKLNARTLEVAGGLTADLHATARLTLGRGTDGSITVGITNVTAAVGPLVPAFTGPDAEELTAFITIGGSDFRRLVENLIGQELIPTFTEKLPPLLQQLLGATDKLLDDVSVVLDPGLGAPVTLMIDSTVGALDVATGMTAGHATVRHDLALRTAEPPIHPTSRGAAQLDTQSPAPVLSTSGVHLTMSEDFLNGLFHTLWNGGLLEGELTSGGITAKVHARLPPVVRPTPISSPCKIDDERCDVILQIGQVDIDLPGFSQSFGVNASAGARIEVNGGKVKIAIESVPTLKVWETSDVHGTLTPQAVSDLIANLVWPALFDAIVERLQIDIPLPDLEALGLGNLAPGLKDAKLQLDVKQRPQVTGGKLVLGADLALETPPPP